MGNNLKKTASEVIAENNKPIVDNVDTGFVPGTDIPVDSVEGAILTGSTDDEKEPYTKEEFIKKTESAIEKGFLGIDRKGKPTNDALQLDSIGPGIRAAFLA